MGSAEEHYLLLSAFLFAVGGVGFFVRRHLLVQLMSLELMLHAGRLMFAVFSRIQETDTAGQTLALFALAAQVLQFAVAVAIVVAAVRKRGSLMTDEADEMRH